MLTNVDGIRFEAPESFVREETMVSLRVPEEQGMSDPRTGTPIRPNVVVHRRPERVADLSRVTARIRAELATAIPGLSPIEAADVTFTDGRPGVLLAYAMPAPKGLEICQLQAMRIDGGVLTTLTISTEKKALTPERKNAYVKSLVSARLSGG